MLPKFKEIEESIGGRPRSKKEDKKIRLTYYLNEEEAQKLKKLALSRDVPVSKIVRELVRGEIR